MRSTAGKLTVALLAVLALTGVLARAHSAQAQIAFGACEQSNEFACGHLTVPLDPSGATSGTLTLAIRRHLAPVGGVRTAVIALAGGPGQAAIPFTETFTEILGPILSTRDLIVFDQRGTGFSHPLSCHAFEATGQFHSVGPLIAACAEQIGPTRAFYTSADTVADIEAIRVAGGYEKLVLYGTSYGTKVAELYAQEHPEHVEALVLDSVVPPNGPDPLSRATFAAIPRVLRALCAQHACAHITREPVADLARLVRRMHGGSVRGRVIDRNGRAHTDAINANDLLGVLFAGDFSPLLRAEFVTAVSAAAERDDAPLARLLARADNGEESDEGDDTPLYFATTCEEQAFPWNRAASPAARIAQAKATIAALPASATLPFTAANMLSFSDIETCAYWPNASPAAAVPAGVLPDVPTLILSGADDLRTPTANARALAAQIPDAHLLVVPYTGHSVLTDEPTPCAHEALLALFAGKPVKACPPAPPPLLLQPPPLPPARLANVPPVKGYHGQPGRTLGALNLTLADFVRQTALALLERLDANSAAGLSSLRSGGLRAGWAQYAGKAFVFHGYSYIPGVTLSGTIAAKRVVLHIGGRAAARGTLRLGSRGRLIGTLGGQRIDVPTHDLPAAVSAIVARAGVRQITRAARLLASVERMLERPPRVGA